MSRRPSGIRDELMRDLIRDEQRRQFAELERATEAPALYVVVFDYQTTGQRFWRDRGQRLVTEYPDADEFRSYGKGKAALGKAADYLKGRVAQLVENYGLTTERVVATSHTEPNEKRRGAAAAG